MFQQFLGFDTRPKTLYTGLYPSGKWDEPCTVKCGACAYTATAPTWAAAQKLAMAHDYTHDTTKAAP